MTRNCKNQLWKIFNKIKRPLFFPIYLFIYFILIIFPQDKNKLLKKKIKNIHFITFSKSSSVSFVAIAIREILKKDFNTSIWHIPESIPLLNRILDAFKFEFPLKGAVNIFVANPNIIHHFILRMKLNFLKHTYNIGLWFWELPAIPLHWKLSSKFMNEIWVYSDFNKEIFKPLNSNIHKIPFAIELKVIPKFDRTYFNLPLKPFIFLFTFDFSSYFSRKNPLAVIQAFKKAFGLSEHVCLVIKSVRADVFKSQMELLKTSTEGAKNILLIDKFFSNEEQASFLNCCDCYVSLHRAEGLGLGMAEAMYLNKPVIATNYSGNLEFMNTSNSCLVDFNLIKVNRHEYIGANSSQLWADPDIAQASNFMIKVYTNKKFRDKIAKKASQDIKSKYSKAMQRKVILSRLKVI